VVAACWAAAEPAIETAANKTADLRRILI
jgi:hypothetical protein